MSSAHSYVPRSMLLQWHVTERCNLHCTHCYQDPSVPPDLSFAQLLSMFRQFEDALSFWKNQPRGGFQKAHITVTGGEPFVRKDFIDLLRVFSGKRDLLSFAILTNGTFIDRSLARELRQLGVHFVQVSMEGSRMTHDSIRGEGNFERTVQALRFLRKAGVRTFVSFTAHRENFREFPAVVAKCRRLGVNRVWTDRFIPISEHSAAKNQTLSPSETRELIESISRERRSLSRFLWRRTEVAAHRALQFLGGQGTPYKCTAGRTLITIQSNGDLVPCRRMPTVVGNLLHTPLLELYEGSPILRSLREEEQTPHECKDCRHAKSCGGGLRCLAFAVHGNLLHPDPGCPLL